MIKQQEGQSLVEFAFLIGFMLLVTVVFINLGMGVYYKIQLNQLAHDMARVYSLADFEEPSETTQKIDFLLDYYEGSGPFVLDVQNINRFNYTVHEEEYSEKLYMVRVQCTYRGAFYPLVGRLQIRSSHTYPKIISLASP